MYIYRHFLECIKLAVLLRLRIKILNQVFMNSWKFFKILLHIFVIFRRLWSEWELSGACPRPLQPT